MVAPGRSPSLRRLWRLRLGFEQVIRRSQIAIQEWRKAEGKYVDVGLYEREAKMAI